MGLLDLFAKHRKQNESTAPVQPDYPEYVCGTLSTPCVKMSQEEIQRRKMIEELSELYGVKDSEELPIM